MKNLLLASLLLPLSVGAATPDDVKGALQTKYPNTHFTDVVESELPGIYEVGMGQNVAYTDQAGRYFLVGNLYDMQAQVDLTAARKEKRAHVDFRLLPAINAIKTVRGDGSRVMAVFSDPECPYCRSLEHELRKLDNVTIYTFIYPIESLHPEARPKAVSVWCNANRERAWNDLMLSSKDPKPSNCLNPIGDNILLASKLGLHATPTMVSADGRILPGARRADEIDAWLSKGGK